MPTPLPVITSLGGSLPVITSLRGVGGGALCSFEEPLADKALPGSGPASGAVSGEQGPWPQLSGRNSGSQSSELSPGPPSGPAPWTWSPSATHLSRGRGAGRPRPIAAKISFRWSPAERAPPCPVAVPKAPREGRRLGLGGRGHAHAPHSCTRHSTPTLCTRVHTRQLPHGPRTQATGQAAHGLVRTAASPLRAQLWRLAVPPGRAAVPLARGVGRREEEAGVQLGTLRCPGQPPPPGTDPPRGQRADTKSNTGSDRPAGGDRGKAPSDTRGKALLPRRGHA